MSVPPHLSSPHYHIYHSIHGMRSYFRYISARSVYSRWVVARQLLNGWDWEHKLPSLHAPSPRFFHPETCCDRSVLSSPSCGSNLSKFSQVKYFSPFPRSSSLCPSAIRQRFVRLPRPLREWKNISFLASPRHLHGHCQRSNHNIFSPQESANRGWEAHIIAGRPCLLGFKHSLLGHWMWELCEDSDEVFEEDGIGPEWI